MQIQSQISPIKTSFQTVKRQHVRRDNQQVIRQPIGPDGTRGFNRKIRT